jgi:hypothetical protein
LIPGNKALCQLNPSSQRKGHFRVASGREGTKPGLHGRQWEPFDIGKLLRASGKKVLSADVGTGKTTLLHWLTKALLDKAESVPLFLPCHDLEPYNSWDDLKASLIKRYKRHFLETDLHFFLDFGPVVFLCDGLD